MKREITQPESCENRCIRKVSILLFLLILLIPRIQQKTHLFYYSLIDENRVRTLKPTGSFVKNIIQDRDHFPKAYEKYFNDNYGLRDLLIRYKNTLDLVVFHMSDEVALGNDGWMEYRNVIERQELANERLTPQQFSATINRFDVLATDLKKMGITLVLVPIPNKNSIYPEHFVSKKVIRPTPTAFQRFTAILKQSPNYHVIDAEKVLLDKKKDHQLFYKTDFHWDDLGGYFVNQATVNELGKISATGATWTEPLSTVPQPFGGVLNASLSTINLPMELVPAYKYDPKNDTPKKKLLPKSLFMENSFGLAMSNTGFARSFTELIAYDHTHPAPLYVLIKNNPGVKYVIFEFIEVNLGEQFQDPTWWDALMK